MIYNNHLKHHDHPGIDEILDLEKISSGNGPFFFYLDLENIELSFLGTFSNVKMLKKNSCSPLEIRDLEKNSLSLLEGMRFCKQILFLFSILHSISLPILVRNHILQFGLILTSSVLQRGKYFKKLFFEEVGDEDAKEFDMVGE